MIAFASSNCRNAMKLNVKHILELKIMKRSGHYILNGFMIAACSFFLQTMKGQEIILTSDGQLTDIAENPDKKIDNTLGLNKNFESLRDVVNRAKQAKSNCISVAFDEFFRQYRDDKNTERNLTPDMDEYVEKIAKVSHFVEKEGNGMGLELSLLSPLELGQAYKRQTGKCGHWFAYKVGSRNAQTGKFSLEMWQQTQWTNNKGETPVKLIGVKAYAFREKNVSRNQRAVNPEDIKLLKDVKTEVLDSMSASDGVTPERRLLISGEENNYVGFNRVLILLEFETQEMDYFASDALPFLKNVLKKYHDHGVNLQALYSDEMHIQQDWNYFGHHEDGQMNMRYLTPSMAEQFVHNFGQPFDERYFLYFVNQPPLFLPFVDAVVNVEYVLGGKPLDVQRTYLMRDNYYRMLNNQVVDLFKNAKLYGEQLFGHELRTSAHSSWAESPTIDLWYTPTNTYAANYEYTPNFVWSNTVHQASAACYDYFKWGEYLQPTGNDFCECGWLDRDYYGAAMAASIGVINKYPNAYAAAWGMPAASYERRMAINYAFGCQPPASVSLLTDNVIRDVDVLMLYPMNLVSVDPRFGSWMTQYGYANYLTSDQLLKLGSVTSDGHLKVCAKEYGTLVIPFEPLPESGLLPFLKKFIQAGGKVIWCSAPPLIDKSGADCSNDWENLFGVKYNHTMMMGDQAAGHHISFCGSLSKVPMQEVLSDLLVDHVFPVQSQRNTEIVAVDGKQTLATLLKYSNGGMACYCGFRPRDDQSQSLGYESRTLFEILNACGAYPATGKFQKVNDNPAVVSRTSKYFVSKFPNGVTMVVNHYRTHVENWPGGFSRNNDEDVRILQNNPLPTDTMLLENVMINGHKVSYEGRLMMGFNTDNQLLTAFLGQRCTGIRVDGRAYRFSAAPLLSISFGPVLGDKNHYRLYADGQTEVTLPLRAGIKSVKASCNGEAVVAVLKNGSLKITLPQKFYGQAVELLFSGEENSK